MADQRGGGISWTETTWNPIRGCTRVSEGCRNCYAERVAARFSGPGQPYDGLAKNTPSGPRWTGKVRMVEDHLDDPLRWKRPRLVFVNSMSDLFHESLDFSEIDTIVSVMARAHWHTFQVLTKRPERLAEYLTMKRPVHSVGTVLMGDGSQQDVLPVQWPLPNVWWGTSVEDQKNLDARLPHLLACREHAEVLWLSMEPLLGPVTLRTLPEHLMAKNRIDWVVVGGESGPGARPMHPAWSRTLRDECQEAGIPFHFKQWGEWAPEGVATMRDSLVGMKATKLGEEYLYRIGKKAAGRLLDGVQHDAFPAV